MGATKRIAREEWTFLLPTRLYKASRETRSLSSSINSMDPSRQQLHDDFTESLLAGYREETQRIALKVGHVSEMFREVALMTIEQQDDLDRIDLEMKDASKHSKSVVTQLDITADRKQKSRCCEYFGLLLAVGVVVGVALWITY